MWVWDSGVDNSLALQVLAKPGHGLFPRIPSGLCTVSGPRVTMEAVSAARIHVEFVGLAVLFQLRFDAHPVRSYLNTASRVVGGLL